MLITLGLGFVKDRYSGLVFPLYISVDTIHFPLVYFLFMNSSVGLNYNSDLTFYKNSVKITVGCHWSL
jgi:hypothetical protein